jgi:acetyltransferase-like isoleucine patch superfamily enzyme
MWNNLEPVNDLQVQLWEMYEAFQKRMMATYDRNLPMGDLLIDRWERARMMGFGEGVSIYDSSQVIGNVTVGADTWIGPFTIIDGSGGLTIGRNCALSAGVHIYTHDTVFRNLSDGKMPVVRKPVSIGDCTYIGPHAVITKGVTIGKHCLIGAHSMVNRDLPDYTIAVGAPARPKGKVLIDDEGMVTLQWDKD